VQVVSEEVLCFTKLSSPNLTSQNTLYMDYNNSLDMKYIHSSRNKVTDSILGTETKLNIAT